jgi:hypothetical protein
MRIAQSFSTYLSSVLSKQTANDGRIFVVIALAIYFISIFISSFFTKYNIFWSRLGVTTMTPAFADLGFVLSAFECHRKGYDILIENPCNEWNHPMNYPRIWMSLAFLGLNQSHTFLLGIFIGFLFFTLILIIIGRLNYAEALAYTIILCSPSVMLGVERGNTDLIIFILLSVALLLLRSPRIVVRGFSYLTLLLAATLKLYPIFALAIVFKENKRRAYILAGVIVVAFILYVFSIFPDLKYISAETLRSNQLSYGGIIIFNILFKLIKLFAPNQQGLDTIKIAMLALVVLLLLVIAYLLVKRRTLFEDMSGLNTDFIQSFRIGAGIYIGTFLLGNNWDYRLMFLIFTIPQILAWIKSNSWISLYSSFAFIGAIITLWLSRWSYTGLDELINWLLFFYFISSLMLTMPDSLKTLFRIRQPLRQST